MAKFDISKFKKSKEEFLTDFFIDTYIESSISYNSFEKLLTARSQCIIINMFYTGYKPHSPLCIIPECMLTCISKRDRVYV